MSNNQQPMQSIRQQMISLGVYMTALALALLMLSTLIYETLEKRQGLINALHVGAEVIGRNSAAAILFGNRADATEVLESMAAVPDIMHAAIFLPNGTLLAEYHAEGHPQCQHMAAVGQNHTFNWCSLQLYHPILLYGEQIGTVGIEHSLKPLYSSVLFGLLFSLVAIIITMGVALSVWRRFATRLTWPLSHLNRVAQQVHSEQNFSLRVNITSNNEVGKLARTFNRMMEQLQQHEMRLQQELNQRRQAEERLNQLAYHDNVTPLYNRHYFMEQLDIVVGDAMQTGEICALLFIDLDGFKKVNDTLGHDAGDTLLHQVATRLKNGVRASDTVCRLGGDEFAVIVKQDASQDQVERLAERLIALMAPAYDLGAADDNQRVFVTASIGVSLCPGQAQDKSMLVKYADIAMYQAKERGKNGYCVYDPFAAQSIGNRFRIENELRNALNDDQLQLFYQPIYTANTRKLTGFEALLRWHHPELGEIPPEVFIPIAESSDMIVPIGKWILEQAAQQLTQWRKLQADLSININLSGLQLMSNQAVQDLISTLNEYSFPRGTIELELTENCLLDASDIIRRRMQELLDAGFLLAVDDFGTGYSSLSYLHHFPFTRIKIDRSFVNRMNRCPDSQALIRAIVAIGNTLNLAITAEGVEDEWQIDTLADLGCEYLQGFALGSPMAANEARILLVECNASTTGSSSLVLPPPPSQHTVR